MAFHAEHLLAWSAVASVCRRTVRGLPWILQQRCGLHVTTITALAVATLLELQRGNSLEIFCVPCKRCSSICVSRGLCHQQRHAVNVGSAPSEHETARWRVRVLGTPQHAMPALFQILCMHTAAFAVLFFLATLQRGGSLAPETMPCCCSFAASLGLAAATCFAVQSFSCVRLDGNLSCFLCCEFSRI